MTEPDKRRRRPAVSCTICRRRKVRCNREIPCNNCVKSKNALCTYETHDNPSNPTTRRSTRPTLAVRHDTPSSTHSRVPLSTASTSTYSRDLTSSKIPSASSTVQTPISLASDSIRIKIRELEAQLSGFDSTFVNSPVHQPSLVSTLGGSFHVHEDHLFGKTQGVVNGITHKTRTFGQSHWINGALLVRDTVEVVEPYVQKDFLNILTNMKRCKSFARTIKLRRSPAWPLQSSSEIPSREIADQLIDCYLETIESVYRILHVPSFKRDYNALWSSNVEPNPAFLLQLKLVLAIGATMYDGTFSLRASALYWVYEAQSRISEPRIKSMLGIQYLQIHLLLLIARETADVSCEMVWISVGTLYRMGIQMGLHRDPALLPKTTVLMAEMRRRLWNTILEVSIQSSLVSGGPPLTSLDDFNTLPPGNFDDEDILTERPMAKSDHEYTHTLVAIALRRTLPFRLAVLKALNDLGSHKTYETILKLDTELRQSYKILRQTLQTCLTTNTSPYALRLADMIMHRYLAALHAPYFGVAFHETAFAFSRKVVIESSLKTWYAAFPSSSNTARQAVTDSTTKSRRDCLTRLVTCGSGFFRVVMFQAAFSLAVELRNSLREEQGMGPVSARPDLLTVLSGARDWCMATVEAGETSVKGCVMFAIISAQVERLLQGHDDKDSPELLIRAAVDAEEKCLPILEAAANSLLPGIDHTETDMGTSHMSIEVSEGWEAMMSDPMFGGDSSDPMTWVFGDDTIEEPSFW